MTLVKAEDWRPHGVARLEDRAWDALRETDRSVCVTAGAGAGKTEFLAQKATYLLQTGICPAPKRILAISFKRDAAITLAERVRRRCPEDQARRFVSLTFDAFTKSLADQFRLALPEQYRPPANYEISFPRADILADFLQRTNINSVNGQQLARLIAWRRINDPAQNVRAEMQEIADAYWHDQYHRGPKSYLTFVMINRLAEYLLRKNKRIRAAIQMSYPIVFLDEFQDAQASQFELLTTAFDGGMTRFTAVGDDKQQIMGWAGAMPDAFDKFTQRFNARAISLLSNWRSHKDLVTIQHIIARDIDPEVEEVVARGRKVVAGDVSAIWEFEDKENEVGYLSQWIADEVASRHVDAHDIAVLVRSHADTVENELAPALAEQGVKLRNVARNVGDIAIEDLLSEDFTAILMPFLRLGSIARHADAWSAAQGVMGHIEGAWTDDELQLQRISARVEHIARISRAFMRENQPLPESAKHIVVLLILEIGEALIRRSVPSYHRDADYARVRDGFIQLFSESLEDASSWKEALDRFEGKDQVSLMTVHKSKGMEFHTMIFFGLDNSTWWSLTPNRDEEKKSFFVAFTRAKQRAFFTSCRGRGGPIMWLERLLGEAVPRIAKARTL